MDENLTLPPVAMLDDAGGNHVTPFSQDEIAQAEAKIGQMVALPDGLSPRLKTRMNPEGLAPREGMGFGENVAGQLRSSSIAGVVSESADLQSVQTGGANMANRGFTDGQLRQLPSRVRERIQAEEAALTPDQKQERLAKVEARVFEQAAYDLSQGNLSIASAGGAIAAGVLSPENFLIGLPNAARGAVSGFVASKLPSARPAIQAALVSGVDAAFGNVIIDPVLQASRVQSGAQEKYDVAQTLLAAPVGFAAGAAIGGGISAAAGGLAKPITGTVSDAAPAPAVKTADGGSPPVGQAVPSTTAQTATATAVAQPAPAKLLGIEPPKLAAHSVATASGAKIDVAPVVVEASTLRASSDAGYDVAIQPRDRTRAASDAQIRDIAANLDPERLGASAEADRGSPIVGPDAMVESGNGRVSAIRAAYAQGGEAAERYRGWLSSLGVDVAGMKEPVLVRQRLTDMTPEQRQRFAIEANQSATLSMSAPERAKADAGILSPSSLDLIRNVDDFGAASNRDFVRAFAQALPVSERASFMMADGSVSAEGLTRAKNAVLARAYDDAGVLSRITESTDDDVKSISSALVAVAPEWAKLRAEIDAGAVRADVDQTAALMEAVRRTADLRSRKMTLDAFLRQQDAFDVLPPEVQAWMAMFYQADGKRAAGKDAIAERLRYYAQEARKVSADEGLFLDIAPVRAADLQAAAAKRGVKDAGTEAQGQSGLFDGGRGGVSRNAQLLRTEGQGRAAGDGGGASEVVALGKQRSNGVRNVIARIKGEDVTARPQGDVLPMAQRQALPQPVDTPFMRQVLDGETQKPLKLPDGAGPEEVHSFRVTEAIGDLAAQLGRKVEVDGRFTLKGAAGEYKLKDGVIRIRQAGDFEAFAHEAGHAIDQDLSRLFSDDWKALLRAHEAELTKLDTNVGDDAAKTLVEGTAEFMRAYVTNPAYARKNMAPQFAAAFDQFIAEKAPGLREWFAGAQRASQIDSGMAPTQRMETMQVSQIEPGRWKQFRNAWKKEGLPIAFRDVWDQFSQAVSGRDQAVYRFVESLKDARFAKTGEAGQAFYKWADPYTTFRQLSGAEQGALDMIWNGVRPYGQMGRAIDRSSPSLHDSIKLAVGRVENISDPDNQAVRAFNGYLIARRAAALYDRYEAGDLRSPPIRASKAEALKAIADYEAANPQFKQAADGVFQFARASLERKRDAGLVSQEMFDAIVAKSPTGEYVPFYRDMQDVKAGGGGAGGVGMERQAIKAIGGSTRDILDPLQSLMMDAIRTERLIAKNDFVRSLHMLAQQGGELGGRFVERIPNSEMKATSVDLMQAVRKAAKERGLEKADAEIMVRQMEEMIGADATATTFMNVETTARGERIMFYWDGGERVALKVGNDKYSKRFFDLMSDMGQAERDLMMGMFGKANAYFTQAITNAPQFGIKNLIMDGITRMFVARNAGAMGRVPFAPLMAGVYSTIFDREFAKAFEALGGMKGGPAAAAVREVTPASGFAGIAEKPKGWRGIADEFVRDQGSWSNVAIGVVKSPVTLVKGMVHVIEATETIGRVGQAKLVYNHLLKNGASEAEAMRGALFESRDILDYDRFGQATTAARRFMPFLNANIQGTSTANQRLLTDPARAVAQWNERGRDWAKVDEDLKTAFTEGLLNWGMIAAGVAMTASYWASMKDSETYQRASSYMKRRYFIVPLPGSGEGGDANYLSIPKPFDLPGAAMSAMEMALDGMARANPDMMEQVSKALADGFIPRMVSGVDEFLGSMPHLKTGYELTLGRTLPFEGSKPRDIVPQALRSLPADQQFTGNTSWLAKKVGEVWGLSPVKVDHAINGLFATAGRDVNDALTASFDNNPNMTQQDAFTKMFFGGLYRRQRGVGSPNNAIHQAMGQDGGKYVVAANGYRKFVESGDTVNADKAFNQADELTKTVMTFRGHNFSPAERQLHPLEHAEVVAQISGSLSRDLAQNMVQVQDRSRKRGEVRGRIEVDSQTARALTTAINSWAAEGILSGLVIAGVPGYQTGKVIDPSERLKYIKALSPQVGEELEKRIEKAHLVPLPHIAEKWDEVKRRLSQDRDAAKFADLVPAGVKLPKNRR